MDMEIGSERVLGPATGALRSIDLFWSGEDGIYQLTEGCLADVVQKNPELERLAVRNVDVSTTEIQQVLIQTAQKLRSLTLPFIGNHRVSDLNAIMQTMAVWNLRLECFEIEKENRWYMAWISNPALNVADAERLACSLNVLRKRIPRLDCFQVERCIALIASGN